MTNKAAKTRTIFALLLQTFTLLSLTLTSQPASAGGFSVTPADHSQRFFNFQITPGEKQSSAIDIENVSDNPITLSVYGADGTQSNQGTFALTTKTAEQKHIGLWTSVAKDTITVKPHAHAQVEFTVNVPTNATPGTYSGGIAVEENSSEKPTDKQANSGNSISISARFVVKLFVTVPGEKINAYEWTNFAFSPASDNKPATFTLSYKNTGNTIITANQEITIKGFPAKEQSFKLPTATLLQNSAVNIPIKWEKEPFFGFYTATAKVVFSEYDIASNNSVNGKTETKNISIYIPLKFETTEGKITMAIAGLIAIIFLLFIISLALKISFRQKCALYNVLEGETITSIAEKCNVDWKKLAKVNKLKPPYTLKAGQKILAPPPPSQSK
jgi:hypothetical protein